MQREKTLIYKGKRHLPLPSGPYTVGCCDVMTSYLKFGVFVRLYYPAKEQGVLKRYLQWPQWVPHKQYINGYAVRAGMPPNIYRLINKVLVGNLYIPVIWQAELKPTEGKYPIVVFSHGLSGWRCTYSTIIMELASRGFVVAALEHRDHSASASFYQKRARMSATGSNPGLDLSELDALLKSTLDFEDTADSKWDPGPRIQTLGPFSQTKEWMLYHNPTDENEMNLRTRQVRFRAKECCEALDLLEDLNHGRYVSNILDVSFNAKMFQDQLDLSKCYFIGHSFGGATGIYSLATEIRFRAGIFLDPWMYPFFDDQSCFPMISQPFLCLLIKSFQTKDSMKIARKLQLTNKDAEFVVLKFRRQFQLYIEARNCNISPYREDMQMQRRLKVPLKPVLRKAQHRDVCDAPFVPRFSFSMSTKLGLRLDKFSALDITLDLILRFLGQQLGGCLQPGSSKLEVLKEKFLSEEDFKSVESD